MIPKILRIDPNCVDAQGRPLPGVQIFANYVQVHPSMAPKAIEGIRLHIDPDVIIEIPEGFAWDGKELSLPATLEDHPEKDQVGRWVKWLS